MFSLKLFNMADGSDIIAFFQIIKSAVEDGTCSDAELVQATKYSSFILVMFLLIIINAR